MKCNVCGSEATTGGFPERSWCQPCKKKLDAEQELPKVRDAIDRACRVIEALRLPEGENWKAGTPHEREERASLGELCELRARERALVAEVEK